jgi:hypothetical protein
MKTPSILHTTLSICAAGLTGCTTVQKLTVESQHARECTVSSEEGRGTRGKPVWTSHQLPLPPGDIIDVNVGYCRTAGLELPVIGGIWSKQGSPASMPYMRIDGKFTFWEIPAELEEQARQWMNAPWLYQVTHSRVPGRMVILRSGKVVWRSPRGDVHLQRR